MQNVDPSKFRQIAYYYCGSVEEMWDCFGDDNEICEELIASGEYAHAADAKPGSTWPHFHLIEDEEFSRWSCDGTYCAHCGTAHNYGCLFVRDDTKEYYLIGHRCSAHIFNFDSKHEQKIAKFKRIQERKAEERRKAHRGMLALCARENRREIAEFLKGDSDFCKSFRTQLFNKGRLSDKQWECIPAAIERDKKWKAEREAMNREFTTTHEFEDGRQMITGIVVATWVRESDYGEQHKMKVWDERGGFIVCSVPTLKIEHENGYIHEGDKSYVWHSFTKGDRISMNITLTQSKDDKHLAWGKRPAKVTLIKSDEDAA